MAIGTKTGGRDFKPGHKFSKGRPRTIPELKALRILAQNELAEIATLILANDRKSLEAILSDPSSSILKVWIARVALRGMARGDSKALNDILDRVVGKVTQKIEASGPEGGPIQILDQRASLRHILDDKNLRDAAIEIGKKLAMLETELKKK